MILLCLVRSWSRSSWKRQNTEGRELTRDSQHGKLQLANLVAFYNGVTASGDTGSATASVCLDFCRAFGMIPHNILLCKLERYGLHGFTGTWLRKWLDGGALKSYGKWLNVQVENGNQWCPSRAHNGINTI